MEFCDFKRAAAVCDRKAKERDKNIKKRHIQERIEQERFSRERENRLAQLSPYLDIPDDITLTKKYIDDVDNNRCFNDEYSEYYLRLADERNDDGLRRAGERMLGCHKYWFGDYYAMQRVFDVKSVQLCHDKFCVNCMHLKQASRLKRFTPVFVKLSKQYDMYHFTFTVPNCSGMELSDVLDRMSRAFKNVVRYFSGDSSLKGIDFKQYGYVGAVRNFEIVVNLMDYHPHIHALFLLKKDLPLYKGVINCYSFNNGKFERKFTELEILIQKIWYLLINGERVNLKAIDTVPVGYSCVMEEVGEDGWHEVFKYITKLTQNGMPYLYYEQFVTLYDVLYKFKAMQGYGLLYRVAKDDSIDEEVAKEYARICAQLRFVEEPDPDFFYRIEDLSGDIQNKYVRAISKKLIQKYLNELAGDNK